MSQSFLIVLRTYDLPIRNFNQCCKFAEWMLGGHSWVSIHNFSIYQQWNPSLQVPRIHSSMVFHSNSETQHLILRIAKVSHFGLVQTSPELSKKTSPHWMCPLFFFSSRNYYFSLPNLCLFEYICACYSGFVDSTADSCQGISNRTQKVACLACTDLFWDIG